MKKIAIIGFLLILVVGGIKSYFSRNEVIVLSTIEWVEVKTDGKEWGAEIEHLDGRQPKYLLAVNSTQKNPIELPSIQKVYLGDKKKIRKVYFLLKPGQGVDNAELNFEWK